MPMIDTDTEEGKAELQKLIDKETEGLKAKNAELLGDVKKQKDSIKAIQDQLAEIESAKQAAEEEALNKSGDVDKIKAALEEKHRKALEELNGKLSERDTRLHKLLVDNGLTEALNKAGITNAALLKAAKSLILSENKAEVGEIDGNAVATINGQSITEFVTAFAQGEDGKTFVSAPDNGGGGAKGSNGGDKVLTKGDFGGTRKERADAIAEKFPELKNK